MIKLILPVLIISKVWLSPSAIFPTIDEGILFEIRAL